MITRIKYWVYVFSIYIKIRTINIVSYPLFYIKTILVLRKYYNSNPILKKLGFKLYIGNGIPKIWLNNDNGYFIRVHNFGFRHLLICKNGLVMENPYDHKSIMKFIQKEFKSEIRKIKINELL